jgi:hypothetical protein
LQGLCKFFASCLQAVCKLLQASNNEQKTMFWLLFAQNLLLSNNEQIILTDCQKHSSSIFCYTRIWEKKHLRIFQQRMVFTTGKIDSNPTFCPFRPCKK